MQRLDIDVPTLLRCFHRHLSEGGHRVTRARFEENLHGKAQSVEFRSDLSALLRPGVPWNFERALSTVLSDLIAHLPGDPWKRRLDE